MLNTLLIRFYARHQCFDYFILCLSNRLRQKILDALQGNDIGAVMDPTKFSRNYKVGSMEGNMIFEGASYLPKEVMLDMTLKAFGYDVDMIEVKI